MSSSFFQDDMPDDLDGCGGMRPGQRQRRENAAQKQLRERRMERRRQEEEDYRHEEKVDPLPPPKRKSQQPKPRAPVPTPLKLPHAVTAGKVVPWSKNSSRTLALRPSYYGVYAQSVQLDSLNVNIHLLALGEWNLPSPHSTLFCVLAEGENWDELAEAEHKLQKSGDKNYTSRFDRAASWNPTRNYKGSVEGTLVVPRSFLQIGNRGLVVRGFVTLCMRYAATTPWHKDYAVVKLVELEFYNQEVVGMKCPRQKPPVPPNEAWRAVFPADVLERFRTRELDREAANQSSK